MPTDAPTDPAPSPVHTGLSIDQVDALHRQQQRILHRALVISYVLGDEMRAEPAAAIADLLDEIEEAARTIGTLLQTATAARRIEL
jgi:hypothetical protein